MFKAEFQAKSLIHVFLVWQSSRGVGVSQDPKRVGIRETAVCAAQLSSVLAPVLDGVVALKEAACDSDESDRTAEKHGNTAGGHSVQAAAQASRSDQVTQRLVWLSLCSSWAL